MQMLTQIHIQTQIQMQLHLQAQSCFELSLVDFWTLSVRVPKEKKENIENYPRTMTDDELLLLLLLLSLWRLDEGDRVSKIKPGARQTN